MNLYQALGYFIREAFVTSLGNWRASLIAVLTCGLSLYIGSFFFLVTGNLSKQTEAWQGTLRISVYLEPDATPETREHLRTLIEKAPWIEQANYVSLEQAQHRFAEAFPQIAAALGEATPMDLPTSIEGTLVASAIDEASWTAWVLQLADEEGVASVDDDRSWVREVQRLALWVRTTGLAVGLALLVAAAFTIAAVVRLTAYRYLDEIAVLRLVGATEFFVRGPFVVEGLLQGLAGGLLAISGLWISQFLVTIQSPDSLWTTVLFGQFLSVSSQVAIVLIGSAAGLFGSILSIRRESLEVLEEQ